MYGYQRALYHYQNFSWGRAAGKTRATPLWRGPCNSDLLEIIMTMFIQSSVFE